MEEEDIEGPRKHRRTDNVLYASLSQFQLQRVANFRDVAGPIGQRSYRCEGGAVRRGMLFRTGQWVTATTNDIHIIRDELGVRTYLDLRNPEKPHEAVDASVFEQGNYPPRPRQLESLGPGERRRVSCDFEGHLSALITNLQCAKPEDWTEEHLGCGTDSQLEKKRCLVQKADIDFLNLGETGISFDVLNMCKGTWLMLILNHNDIKRAMDLLADERNYPVAFGCTAGKDRTGLLGLLCLGALGVSRSDIKKDYLLTNQVADHIAECTMHNYLMVIEQGEAARRETFAKDIEHVRETFPELYSLAANSGLVDAAPHGLKSQRQCDCDTRAELPEDVGTAASQQALGNGVNEAVCDFVFQQLYNYFGDVIGYLSWIGFHKVTDLRNILVLRT